MSRAVPRILNGFAKCALLMVLPRNRLMGLSQSLIPLIGIYQKKGLKNLGITFTDARHACFLRFGKFAILQFVMKISISKKSVKHFGRNSVKIARRIITREIRQEDQ